MNLAEAKKHMLENDCDWSYYIKRMDSASRDQMVTEQRALMRAEKKVTTPRTFAEASRDAAVPA